MIPIPYHDDLRLNVTVRLGNLTDGLNSMMGACISYIRGAGKPLDELNIDYRLIASGIRRDQWPAYIFRVLTPGGWAQCGGMRAFPNSDNNSVPDNSPLLQVLISIYQC
jgi:hypothetical protein